MTSDLPLPYALAFLAVFGINVLPALAPPTWAVLVAMMYAFGLEPLFLVPTAAAGAALGRYALAGFAEQFRDRLSAKRRAGLDRMHELLERNQSRLLAMLVLFLWSPLPSNQLFIAAGLLDLPLRRLAIAFFCGRLVTYTAYLQGAILLERNLGAVWREHLLSPAAIAVQAILFAGLAGLVLVDWVAVFGKGPKAPPPSIEE